MERYGAAGQGVDSVLAMGSPSDTLGNLDTLLADALAAEAPTPAPADSSAGAAPAAPAAPAASDSGGQEADAATSTGGQNALIISNPQSVTFSTQGVPVPLEIYVRLTDLVRLIYINTNPTVTVLTMVVRFLTPDGLVNTDVYSVPAVASDGQVHDAVFSLAEGFILSVAIGANSDATDHVRGRTYVAMGLSTQPAPAPLNAQLVAAYVTAQSYARWPLGVQEHPTEGRGYRYASVNAVGTPGQPSKVQTPTGTQWTVKGVTATLFASAAAGNRRVRIFTSTANQNSSFDTCFPTDQTANQVHVYHAGPGFPLASTVDGASGRTHQYAPLPEVLLQGGVVEAVCDGMDAADQFNGLAVHVEEWVYK